VPETAPARTLDECEEIVARAVAACTSLPIGLLDPETLATSKGLVGKSFEDLGFDSLAFMEFCIAIQLESGVELSADGVAGMGSPDAVARHLCELG
jgi:hypothetical protein